MLLDVTEMPEEKQAYFLELQDEAKQRMRMRKAKRAADLEFARVEEERDAVARRLAEEYAISPEGIVVASAAVEAADAAERMRALAAVAAYRSRVVGGGIGNFHNGSAAPVTPRVTPVNLSVGDEEEEEQEDEEEEGETEGEA